MKLKLVYYAFRSNHFIMNNLSMFKNEISKSIPEFSELEIINGEENFRNTYLFINHLITPMILTLEIDFEGLRLILREVSQNIIQTIENKYPKAYKFFIGNVNRDKISISESLRIKTLICVEQNRLRIKGQPNAHGLSESNGRYAVVIKSYRNIVWHEVAHLFGSDDHYIENDVYKMKEKCTNKQLCVMQYDPGDKPCTFCSAALKEISDKMFTETNGGLSLDDLQ